MEIRKYKSIETLLDLRGLIDKEQMGFIDQAIFYLLEEKKNQENSRELRNIKKFVAENIERQVQKFQIKNDMTSQVNFCLNSEVSLKTYNKIEPNLFEILELVDLFSPDSLVSINLSEKELCISFFPSSEALDLTKNNRLRPKAYFLIRKLLSQNILFTYGLDLSNKVILSFNLEPIGTSFFRSDLDDNTGLYLDNYFSSYQASLNKLEKLRKHLVFIFDKKGRIIKEDKIPKSILQSYKDSDFGYSIFHFSFLFRPISMIIPKGNSTGESLRPYESNEARNAGISRISDEKVFINLFNLFSK